jgi:hypothetical protein
MVSRGGCGGATAGNGEVEGNTQYVGVLDTKRLSSFNS